MPKFIVLSGKKQSGKTTFTNFIKVYINEVRPNLIVETTSFAAPIKKFCQDILGLSKSQIYGTDKEKNSNTHIMWDTMPAEITGWDEYNRNGPIKTGPMTAREVMQIFGTDIMRTFFDYDIWAKVPFQKDWGTTDVVIIDDCRFPNEADITLKNNGILIRLTRNPLNDTHISEMAMDDYDENKYTHLCMNNNFTLKQLDYVVRRFLCSKGYTK